MTLRRLWSGPRLSALIATPLLTTFHQDCVSKPQIVEAPKWDPPKTDSAISRCRAVTRATSSNPGAKTSPLPSPPAKSQVRGSKEVSSSLAALLMALMLAACAAPSSPPGGSAPDNTNRQGKIEQIAPTTIASSQHTGVGAVVGGLAGVGIGSLIGGGTGRDVAMVVGAIGGTMTGTEVAKRYDSPVPGQQIFVRTNAGVLVEVTQPANPGLRVGQPVFIQGNGADARVVPQPLSAVGAGSGGSAVESRGGGEANLVAHAQSVDASRPITSAQVPLFPSPPKPDSEKASDTVRLLFGTNRRANEDSRGSLRDVFTSTLSELAFGYVDVSIPPSHLVGEIERPQFWKLEFSENATEHMVIRNIAIVQRSQFADIINQYRGPSSGKPTILFVHGYNVSFDDAALRTAQIANDLRIDSVPAFFSWASRADRAKYTLDENTALRSVPDFKALLRLFAANSTDRVFLIAHSMGSRIVTQALTEMIEKEPHVVSKVVQLVLAAPDLDAVVFKEQVIPAFRAQKMPVTLYASSRDKTLKISSKVHGCCRAGLGGRNIVMAEGLESVDASSIESSFWGHSYFAETRPLLTDLNLLLAQGLRAASRPLLAGKPVGNLTYYYFRR